jgi:hypothetical protein
LVGSPGTKRHIPCIFPWCQWDGSVRNENPAKYLVFLHISPECRTERNVFGIVVVSTLLEAWGSEFFPEADSSRMVEMLAEEK